MTALTNMPARYYTDPAIYELERQRLFRSSWQLVGPVSQVAQAGSYLAVELANWKLFVLRGKDGVLRGFHNVCRHRGARLLPEGQGQCDVLRCPYHLWLYDQEGRLRKAPWFGDDPDFRVEDFPLEPISLDVWRGLLFVSIAPSQPLLQQLGALPAEVADFPIDDFQMVESRRFVMRSNWKTYTDNFVEGYHVPGIHPGFRQAIQFEHFETVAHDGLVRMTCPMKEGYFYGGKWMWLWPAWTLSVYPDGMNTSRINPLGPNETELIYHFYFADTSAATAVQRRHTIESNCRIVEEDFEICEETQKNYASGAFTSGPLSPRHEQGVAYFQQRLLATIAPRAEAAE